MYVIDASVYVSRLKASETLHSSSKRLLELLRQRRIPAYCPNLLWAEVAAAISHGTDDPALGRAAFLALRRLPFHTFVPLDERLAASAAGLAARHGLRGADAVYAALARHLRCPLVTLDEEQASRSAGVVASCSPAELVNSLQASAAAGPGSTPAPS